MVSWWAQERLEKEPLQELQATNMWSFVQGLNVFDPIFPGANFVPGDL